jgi:hypothetical protein
MLAEMQALAGPVLEAAEEAIAAQDDVAANATAAATSATSAASSATAAAASATAASGSASAAAASASAASTNASGAATSATNAASSATAASGSATAAAGSATSASGSSTAASGSASAAAASASAASTSATAAAASAASAAGAVSAIVVVPSGRLSFSSTSAAPTSDISGSSAQTLYYIDVGGGRIPIWSNASSAYITRTFTGSLQLALDSNSGHVLYHAADQVYDVYAFWDAALGSVRIGTTGQAGYTFSQRGVNITDVTLKNGIWVNAADSYLRINNTGNTAGTDYLQAGTNQATYLGSIGTVAAAQGEDSITRRLVFNAYNPKVRNALKKFTGSAYAYNTQAYRQVNADATMQVETLSGLSGVMHRITAQHYAVCSSVPAAFATSVGLNGTTGITASETFGLYARATDTGGAFGASFDWEGRAPLGRNVWKWLEWGSGGTTTWQPNGDFLRNGIRVTALEI